MNNSIPNLPDHQRRSIRLDGYNYALAGIYFITTVAQGRELVFGKMRDGEVLLSPAGEMLSAAWMALPERFPDIELDEFMVMPNHFHGIVVIRSDADPVGATLVVAHSGRAGINPAPAVGDSDPIGRVGINPTPTDNDPGLVRTNPAPTLGDIIGAFKSITTHEYILGVRQNKWPPFDRRLWQRNYYEHILRSEDDLDHVRGYIRNNPLQWAQDSENPESKT